MKTLTFVFLLITAFSTEAGGFFSGNQIFGWLKNDLQSKATYETGAASGYILGVFDTIAGVYVCAPNTVTVLQVKQIVFNYMQAHPELWNKAADFSIVPALSETWPCNK